MPDGLAAAARTRPGSGVVAGPAAAAVNHERLLYELPEHAPVAAVSDGVLLDAQHEHAAPVEAGALFVLGGHEEPPPTTALEHVDLDVRHDDVQPAPTETAGLTVITAPELASTPAAVQALQGVFRPPASSVLEYTFQGRADWTNPGNATGRADGSNATINSDALATRSGGLSFVHAEPPAWLMALPLLRVEMVVTFTVTLAGLATGQLAVNYSIGGGSTRVLLVEDSTGGVTTRTVQLPNATTWQHVVDIAFTATAVLGISIGSSVAIDSLELRATADYQQVA